MRYIRYVCSVLCALSTIRMSRCGVLLCLLCSRRSALGGCKRRRGFFFWKAL